MMRLRFQCNAEDPRPVNWPIPHPYWITGYTVDDQEAFVVTYTDDGEDAAVAYILQNWPDARQINVLQEKIENYIYTARFPKPDWMTE